ncbi:MAG TPA: hypothetical protein ENJ50_05120, partial [Planctomycetaceae bacterium]|nr:hypothetical protein [Planctomycetaceae bacterium]
QAEAAKKNAPTSTAEQRPAESASKTNESKQPATQPAASDHADRKAPGPPPIVVAPGPSGLTIASDDKEALEQFEQLLRAILERRGSGGREFTIFQLRNANAAVVADTLQKLFESAGAFRGGFGAGLSIVPDPRLNALIVQGNRNDLAAIENLVKVLDTSEVPETLVANRPKLIPLKNARADEVADVLRDVYREQMRPKSRSQLPVPRGVSRDLAQVLQSINAQNTGPELTVGVDEDSNSLVVAAAPPLLSEVEQLVQRLDETAERLTRSVRVISLEKTNAETVQDALRMLLPEIKTRRGRRRSR